MISQIYIISLKGDILAFEDYRHDIKSSSHDLFLQLVNKDKDNHIDPVLEYNGVKYFHICRDNLYFVATSLSHIGKSVAGAAFPMMAIELLGRLHSLCKDFCGVVSEASIRANTLLVHELLGQLMEYGYIQLSTTDKLKPCILSEAKPISSFAEASIPSIPDKGQVLPSTAANKPVVRSWAKQEKQRNEIFVDIIERLVVVVNADSTMSRSEVSGEIQMKCFLSGQPQIKLGLNEGLVVSQENNKKGFGVCAHVDNCRFHTQVKLDEFESSRTLIIQPPEGQFTVMNYHIDQDLPNVIPFRLFHAVETIDASQDLELTLKLRCEIPSNKEALRVTAYLPVPKSTTSLMQQCSGPWQEATFESKEKKIVWKIKKFPGGSEAVAKFRLVHGNTQKSSQIELGPLALVDFEISSYVCSNLQIRFLKVLDQDQVATSPHLWLKYILKMDDCSKPLCVPVNIEAGVEAGVDTFVKKIKTLR